MLNPCVDAPLHRSPMEVWVYGIAAAIAVVAAIAFWLIGSYAITPRRTALR